MKKISLLIVSVFIIISLSACTKLQSQKLTLDVDYDGKSFVDDGIGEITVYKYNDGDTVFFGTSDNYFKVRFLGVDTPETVGDIEPFGKAASNFTYERLSKAKKIVGESEVVGEPASYDQYGRYLGYIWYIPENSDNFVNLNLELVEAGYSKYQAVDKYDDYFKKAATYAEKNKLGIWSGEDSTFSKEVTEVSLKELSTNFDKYLNKRVKFTGYVTKIYQEVDDTGMSVIVEDVIDGVKYQVPVYKHTISDAIYYVGNKSEFIGYATDLYGLKRITGVTLEGRDTVYSKVLQKGYFLQFGIDVGVTKDSDNHIYSKIKIVDIVIDSSKVLIKGLATRYNHNVDVTIEIENVSECNLKIGDYITAFGYSNEAVDKNTESVSIIVNSIADLTLVEATK